MFGLLFTRPGATGYRLDESVEVESEVERCERVRMAFVRQVAHYGEAEPDVPVVVTGDFTKLEIALPGVEAPLYQLVVPAGV